jgi:2-polyprenyl-3-methyl-5-hydroxy-6-metoxy-1,4-benzoquinol methylase
MTTSIDQQIDPARVEKFGEELIGVINAGSLAIVLSLGHKTGLFDTMRALGPASSDAIAERAGLVERYVREALGALVTGGIVEYDPQQQTYHLPAEHAELLTRSTTSFNMAATMQFLPMLAQVEPRILECFRHGGGLEYGEFPHFHTLMAEESDQTVVASLEHHVLPLIEGLDERLRRGIDVLDIGCGRGHAVLHLAERYPASRFVGYDLCDDAIEHARTQARERGLTNVRFEQRDVTRIGEPRAYDLVTAFDAIHDQARPATVLAEVQAALREDGLFLMQDIRASSHLEKNVGHPLAPFLYTISCMHCMSVSLAQDGDGLGTVWGEERARAMLDEAGFTGAVVHQLEHDIMNNWYVARPAA